MYLSRTSQVITEELQAAQDEAERVRKRSRSKTLPPPSSQAVMWPQGQKGRHRRLPPAIALTIQTTQSFTKRTLTYNNPP